MQNTTKISTFAGIILPLLLAVGCVTAKKTAKEEEAESKVYISNDPRSSLKISSKKAEMPPVPKAAAKGTSRLSLPDQINVCRLYLLRGDFAGATKIIDEVLEADFRNRDAKILYANILFARGQKDNARALLEQLGGINAKESEALNLLALIAVKDRDIPKAATYLQAAIKRNPEDLSARMNLGVIQLQLQMLDPAKKLFSEVLARKADHADATVHLGIVHAWQGNLAQAEAMYRKAEQIGGRTPLLVFNLAVLKKRQKKFQEALALLREYAKGPKVGLSGRETALALIRDIRSELVVQESKDTKQIDELVAQLEKDAGQDGKGDGETDFVVTSVGVFEAH
jgi:tetratricopeptide (TPR) repeat protein